MAGNISVSGFWGKAQPHSLHGPRWHPLEYHCLDVAAVGAALLVRHRGLEDGIARLVGLQRQQAADLTCFLLCLHDIGKFARKFQAKVPPLYPGCFGDDPARLPTRYDHGSGGLRLFDAADGLFRLPKGSSLSVWRPLISAVTGHHGSPPVPSFHESRVSLQQDYGRAGIEAAGEFAKQVRELFSLPQRLSRIDGRSSRRASFAIAGVAVLADWIGSDQRWFPYCASVQNLETYWESARHRANDAVDEAGVLPAASSQHLDYGALIGKRTPRPIRPSPMQAWAASVELPPGPALFMVEDETGSGKTEAALMLAHRLMAARRAEGIYVALPTMATANAMFDRLIVAHRRLFAEGVSPSIALAHGAREMHQGFRSAMRIAGRNENSYSGDVQPEDSDITASAACAAWIADDRRRTFLADVGAGTVDQALLSVLPNRHQSLRLLGLMLRVLILDEVHAYDAYMQREIEALLEFQAGLGGCAILLSASLPLVVRTRLEAAYAKGLDDRKQAPPSGPEALNYPLATVCAAGERIRVKVPGRAERARRLPVRFLRTPEAAFGEVEEAARAGKAVLYIRNTVDDVLDAHRELTARGLAPGLFHARFALVDRLQIERRVVKDFGSAGERPGRVLIATQVVEQSLDLDFDAMVTDLAPIDLLIQRAGRLWRHEWRKRDGRPELLVVAPEPEPDAGATWYRDAFPRAAYVYKDHARLWLTARVLEDAGVIASPDGLRDLVEAVYGTDAPAHLPQALTQSFEDAEGRAGRERGISNINVLNLTKGYVRDGGAWDKDVRTPTRLDDEPQVTLRLARVRDGRVEPYAYAEAPDELWRAWRLSELNVSARRISRMEVPAKHASAAQTAIDAWTRYDQEKILVVCEAMGPAVRDGLIGSGATASQVVCLTYNPRLGLRWLSGDAA